jgi:hypothetical protein
MPDRDRDQLIERWLRRTPAGAAPADDCLDAETLAAWSEGRLEGAERSGAESHASACGRCQAMLAVMVRTTPAPASGTASPIRRWLMFLGPAMAAAAAVALWFAVDPSQRSAPSVLRELSTDRAEPAPATKPAPEPVTSAPAEKDTAPNKPLDSVARTEASAAREGPTGTRQRDVRVGAEKSQAPSPARGDQQNEKKLDSARSDRALSEAENRAGTPSAVAIAGPPPAAAAPAPPPPAPTRLQEARGRVAGAAPSASQAQNNQAQDNQAQSNQAQNSQAPQANQAQAPPPRQQALEDPVVRITDSAGSRVAARKAAAAAETASLRRAAAVLEIRTPDPAVLWRIVDGRLVQRSHDAGSTWADQFRADEGATLTAGVAPSTTASWIVGRAGVIVRTADGRAWQRVQFAEPLDFTAVVAADARTATVTGADGRQFATTDGGTTWTRR